jgi:hypothetical protein
MTPRSRLPCGLAALVLALGPAAGFFASSARAAGSPGWEPVDAPAGAVVALAYDAASGRLAAADRGAVWLGPADGPLVPVARVRGVHEIAFARDGALWIAGESGLRRWRAGHAREALGVGGDAVVRRIRGAGGRWIAAASDGLHLHRGDGPWQRLDLPLPAGPVVALAVARAGPGLRLGAVIDGVAHWLTLEDADAGVPAARGWSRVGTAGEGTRAAADVWLADDAEEGWTLLRNGCLWRSVPRAGAAAGCAPLPPGGEARRLFRAGGRWWLASDRGLLVAEAAAGPWRREAPPLGSLEAHALAGGEGRLFVGTERGLLVSRAAVPASPGALAPAAGAVSDLPAALLGERGDPPLEAVRRAALAYLDLGAPRLRRLRRGAERRGWLPTVALRLDRDRDRSRRDDFDEAFVSGGLRSLVDRQDDRGASFGASLSLEWDLGDVLYHPESVDVSRETRELVELRDDVLDEIHHLYFERRRVLLELLALPAGRPLEAARLRLRADELAAGIDAWTGGWFGRHAARLAP